MANNDKSKEYAELLEDENFEKWVWSKDNCNKLIKYLNSNKSRKEIVRREKYSPYAYGIVLNVDLFDENYKERRLKFVKIGFTQQDTDSDCRNRMTDVEKDIEKRDDKYKDKTSVLFVIMKNPVDTSTHSEFETNFRKRWGMPVSNEFAQHHNLPFHTEWVLTTQGFIDDAKKVIEEAEKEGRVDASIFKERGIKFEESKIPQELRKHRRE